MRKAPLVIINADDFGYSQAINAAIFQAISIGRVSSATLMANGPAIDEAVAMAAHLPQASFGIHLNLTEFAPLLSACDLHQAGLVNREGIFLGDGFRQLRPSPRLLAACDQELDQQLLHLHGKGLRPSHLDSHHHIHTIPWLLPVIWKLQNKYKIYRLRNTLNVYPVGPGSAGARLLAAKKIWQSTCALLGCRMTDRFASLGLFLADSNQTSLRYSASFFPAP